MRTAPWCSPKTASWTIPTSTSPDGAFVYVAVSGGIEVKIIRTSDNTVVGSVAVGQSPYGVTVLPGGAFVYVANHGANSVSIVRTSDRKVVKTIAVEAGPTAVRASADGRFVYVTSGAAGSVSVIGY
uniref:YncE family protein n=1 Tax=candidate division WOR-3 bacterium TaxID=2052148 RepID=A0A7C4CCF4_UNCW3